MRAMPKKTNWTKTAVSKGFGTSGNTGYDPEAAKKLGRTIRGVKPTDKDDARDIDFVYTIPEPGIDEPILLTGYPYEGSQGYILNALGDHFRATTLDANNISEDHWTEMPLASDGVKTGGSILVRQLNPGQRHLAQENLIVGAPDNLPVIWVRLPDADGNFANDGGCDRKVMEGDLMLFSRMTYIGEDVADFAEHIKTPEDFSWWWEQMSEADLEKSAVALISADPHLSDLYKAYAEEWELDE